MNKTVQAAGAVLWRWSPNPGSRQFAIIHRPAYDDWTLPKGKLDPGETPLQAAYREVAEETGQRVRVGEPLGAIRYQKNGHPKVVRYWAMEATGGTFVPGDEVDDLRWCDREEAAALLSYERDARVLNRFATESGVR